MAADPPNHPEGELPSSPPATPPLPTLGPSPTAYHRHRATKKPTNLLLPCAACHLLPAAAKTPVLPHHQDSHGIMLLRELIIRDVGDDGGRWLLPFLTTGDRLRLSECSKGLMRYRNYLSTLIIRRTEDDSWPSDSDEEDDEEEDTEGAHGVHCHHDSSAMDAALVRLVSHQRCLNHLRVGDQEMMAAMMEGTKTGAFVGLKRLDLLSMQEGDEAAPGVGAMLAGGGCRGLEELNVTVSSGEGFELVTGALAQGACPKLQRLTLSSFSTLHRIGANITKALRQGSCRWLRELLLICTDLEGVIEALADGCFPDLRRLELAHCRLSSSSPNTTNASTNSSSKPSSSSSLGDALASCCCPKLETLELAGTALADEEVVLVARAINSGGCPCLKRLDLDRVGMGPNEGRAVAHALASGRTSSQSLNHLSFCGNDQLGDDAVTSMVKALGELPHLHHLGLSSTGLGDKAAQALINTLQDHTKWKQLKRLQTSFNNNLSADMKEQLVAALRERRVRG